MNRPLFHSPRPSFPALLLALCLVVSGCGIDRGGAPASIDLTPALPGATSTKATVGPVTRIDPGSVTINDSIIDVTAAAIMLNGTGTDLSMLRVGHYAVARSSVDNGVARATTLAVDLNVDGPVSAYDAATDTLTALGQNIVLGPATVIDAGLAGLDLDDRTAVPAIAASGYTAADGRVVATFVAPGSAQAARLTGFASAISAAAFRFDIGALTVDFSSPLMLALLQTDPAINERLTVTGPAPAPGQPLQATTVTSNPLLDVSLPAGAAVDLAGLITRFVSSADFDVAFIPAALAANAQLAGGAPTDLATDRLVHIRGTLQPGAGLQIDQLTFLP